MARPGFAMVYERGDRGGRTASAVLARAARGLREMNGVMADVAHVSDRCFLLGADGADVIERPSAIVAPGRSLAAVIRADGQAQTDEIGLSHCCWGQVDDVVVVSDSALVVAAAIGADLDPRAVGVLSLMGFLLGGLTLFQGVSRLEAGQCLTLRGDQAPALGVDTSSRHEDLLMVGAPTSPTDGATIIASILGELLKWEPDPVIELSGGLDSRAVLAAIPPDHRAGLRAITLGRADHPDVRVAARLASHCKLRWSTIDPHPQPPPAPPELMSATVAAARRRDHVGNALAALTLDRAEAHIPEGPRLTGANGEFARGFYYPGVLTDGPVTRQRVRKLARWRLFTNDGSAAGALREDVVREAREFVVAEVESLLVGEARWRAATDEFYLTTRMANWAGPGYSSRDPASPALAPFLHPAFLAWSRSLPNRRRVRERRFASIVGELDSALAAIPLDRGPSVATVAAKGPTAVARDVASTAEKAWHKVGQRARRRAGLPSLTGDLASAVQAGWGDAQSRALEATGLFRSSLLAGLERGMAVDGPTLSLAINVSSAHDFVTRVAQGGSAPVDEHRDG